MFFAMQNSAIFPVVPYNVSLWSMIRYLCGFILHQVEIQHTNDLLRNILQKIIEIFKLFLLLLREWNRLYGIEALLGKFFYFLKRSLKRVVLYLWPIICLCSCTFPFITQKKGQYMRMVSKNQVFPDHATTNPCEILLEHHSLACRMVLYLMFNHYAH